jgi:hypothetical protein
MPRELERVVIELVRKVYGGNELATPDWLQRPERGDAGRRWRLIRSLYTELTGMELPDSMPPRERRTVDCVVQRRGEPPRIVEFDETQHFNRYRALTIRRYPRSVRVAFDRRSWLAACDSKRRLEGGGFGKPKPPLFPQDDGRHRQRAYRDALADVLPAVHGWLPTLRIADFEVSGWVYERGARAKMSRLIIPRLEAADRSK